jgi:DNA replication and repair protein RecF
MIGEFTRTGLTRCGCSLAVLCYMALTRLSLTDFRNYAAASFRPAQQFVVLHGANGAGKTNILEAVSLLVPGRGLRGASLGEVSRSGGNGGFTVAAEIEDISLGTGVAPDAPGRRKVRINGATASINALAEWLSIVWLTPPMDRLFADGSAGRRGFLDRMVLALEPGHARACSRYDLAMRQRNKLLASGAPVDPKWVDAVEMQMAKNAHLIGAARHALVSSLSRRLAGANGGIFAVPEIALIHAGSADGALLRDIWAASRKIDAAAGRTLHGPHRTDLKFIHAGTQQPAARCSTGEQKALLLSAVLTHAEMVAAMRGQSPLILLDEVAAHLDPLRRTALFERLAAIGSQVWMTGTEASLFSGIGGNSAQFIEVTNGELQM